MAQIELLDILLVKHKNEMPDEARRRLPFFRVWCLVEIGAAVDYNIPLVIKCGTKSRHQAVDGPPPIGTAGIGFESDWETLERMPFLVDVGSAEASVAADRERIIGAVEASPGGCNALNTAIIGAIVGSQPLFDRYDPHYNAFLSALPVDEQAWGFPAIHAAALGDSTALDALCDKASAHARMAARGGCAEEEEGGLLGKPLITACLGGHQIIVEKLMEHGARSSVESLIAACRGGNANVVRLLLACPGVIDMIDREAAFGRDMMLDVAHRDVNDWGLRASANGGRNRLLGMTAATPLIAAAGLGHIEVMEILLANGADPNHGARHNTFIPIFAACTSGTDAGIRLLLAHGADVEARVGEEEIGMTPLMLAAQCGKPEAVAALLAAGGSPSAKITTLPWTLGVRLVLYAASGYVMVKYYMWIQGVDGSIGALAFLPLAFAACFWYFVIFIDTTAETVYDLAESSGDESTIELVREASWCNECPICDNQEAKRWYFGAFTIAWLLAVLVYLMAGTVEGI